MTKKEVRSSSENYFLKVEGEELRRIIERLSTGQQIMSSKIDEILSVTSQ